MAKSTEVATREVSLELSAATQHAVAKIEGILAERDDKLASVGSELSKALTVARTIQAIRASITPEMLKDVVALQGTRLGFRTDRDDKGGYSDEIVRDCAIEALMNGVHLVGNEMNIIASNFYATKEAFSRKLKEFPGLTDLDIECGVPKRGGDRATVTCHATWKLNGSPMELTREISIRVNSGMIDDAILGKADRKMKAAIWTRLTGSVLSDGEAGDMETITVPREPLPAGVVRGSDLMHGRSTSEPAREDSGPTLESLRRRMDAATTRDELRDLATAIKSSGLSGSEMQTLREHYARRNEELVE